jgi:hypothetical protein
MTWKVIGLYQSTGADRFGGPYADSCAGSVVGRGPTALAAPTQHGPIPACMRQYSETQAECNGARQPTRAEGPAGWRGCRGSHPAGGWEYDR